MAERWLSPCGLMELRHGDWLKVLTDVPSPFATITDPPYSKRVEDGFRRSASTSPCAVSEGMGYDPIASPMIAQLAELLVHGNRWGVVCCDHETWREHEAAALGVGRYVFAPVVIAKTGYVPRLAADGPASGVEYMCVSRPRRAEYMGWGSLPGWYPMQTVRHGHGHGHVGVSGAKSIELMRAIIRDYTRPGDLIIDPFSGGATTLLAAALEGRRAIGAELDPSTYALAVKRLSAGYTPSMFHD